MLIERLVKIIMSGGLALLCALIALGNILDPEPNLSFVRHVLSMDTITRGGSAAVRAMPIPTLWRVSFWLIVTGEAVAAVLFALGTVELTRARSPRRGPFKRPSASSTSAPRAVSSSGSSALPPSAANGSRCGCRIPGTANRPLFASACSFSRS